eukprot:3145402-Rhodomonas_salina.2
MKTGQLELGNYLASAGDGTPPMLSTVAMSASQQSPPRPASIVTCVVCQRVQELDARGYPRHAGSTVRARCGHHFC